MSAVARDYAYVVKKKKDAPQVPTLSEKRIEAAKAAAEQYRLKK